MHELSETRAEAVHEQWIADTAMLLLLMLARWSENPVDATVSGKTLGIVGVDHSAEALARRAGQGFGMKVLLHDVLGRGQMIARHVGAEVSPSLDHLLAEADFVSLHGRHPRDGAGFINAQKLNQMKPEACLINTGSGALVDEQALLHALWFETIGGAGIISVPWSTSPRLTDLCTCDNAIILSHPDDSPAATTRSPAMIPARSSATSNIVQLFEGSSRPG